MPAAAIMSGVSAASRKLIMGRGSTTWLVELTCRSVWPGCARCAVWARVGIIRDLLRVLTNLA